MAERRDYDEPEMKPRDLTFAERLEGAETRIRELTERAEDLHKRLYMALEHLTEIAHQLGLETRR